MLPECQISWLTTNKIEHYTFKLLCNESLWCTCAVKVKVQVHTLDIAPHCSESPVQKRSGIARVLKEFQFYNCTPTRSIHPKSEWAILPLPSQLQLVLIYRPRRDGRLSKPCSGPRTGPYVERCIQHLQRLLGGHQCRPLLLLPLLVAYIPLHTKWGVMESS